MKLLLALDLGPHHETLFEAAHQWTERLRARLDILYVLPFAPLPSLRDPALQAALEAELQADTTQRNRITELMSRLPAERRGAILTRSGNPGDELIEAAPDYDALLLGTHGRTGLERLWLGSVAERVVRLSPTPVIVLPLRGLDS